MAPAGCECESRDIDRLIAELRRMLVGRERGGSDYDDGRTREVLQRLSCQYGADARVERRVMFALYLTFLASAVGAGLIAWTGLAHTRERSHFRAGEFTSYGIVSLVVALLALVVLWQAASHRRQARESVRLQRQLAGLDAYVAQMPPALRDLLRATMAKQLFPRTLEDNEPWREPRWPSADEVLRAVGSRPDA
jgi:hypothetical protein